MRICVYGAGAVGGHLAAKLADAGHEVSVVARGANLLALQTNGLRLEHGERAIEARPRASEDPAALGRQDLVLVTLKANALQPVAQAIGSLLDDRTPVVFAQNGIPWWYAIGLGKTRPSPPDLSKLDPGGALARAIGPERIIGAVVYSANVVKSPGVVHNYTPGRNMLTIGAADDRASPQVRELRKILDTAGMHSPECLDIRQAIWSKLLLNLATSTLCLLSGGTVADVRGDPELIRINKKIDEEGRAIAAAHGIDPSGAPERPGGGHGSGRIGHKPSMIQDYELGRPMEVEAQLVTPLAFGRAAGVPTPTLEALVALVAYRAAAKGLYRS
ncbi:MAG: 2-dehydropantoate 2-reductase [Betaproteobacteria bacterium]|nr:2-dehydropantoate 2-reductase [Betaproteobacteria bacterium]